MKPLFATGRVVATSGVMALLSADEISGLITRHIMGDWGDLDEEDKIQNENAIVDGYRIFSAYKVRENAKVWVITEADRASTTVLLPDEY